MDDTDWTDLRGYSSVAKATVAEHMNFCLHCPLKASKVRAAMLAVRSPTLVSETISAKAITEFYRGGADPACSLSW